MKSLYHRSHALRLLALAGLLPPAAMAAQVDTDEGMGMATNWPAAVIVDGRVGLKGIGDQTQPPITDWTALPPVKFGIQHLIKTLNELTPAGSPGAIDAISSGNAIIKLPVSSGLPTLTDNWLSVTMTLTNNSTPTNTLFGADNTSIGGSLVTHYASRSQLIHPSYPGTTRLDQTSEQLGLGTTGTIEGIDYGLGLLALAYKAPKHVILPHNDVFYFSVTPAFAGSLDGLDFATDPVTDQKVNAHAGDVYRMKRNEARWEDPTVYVNHTMLGFLDSAGVDIDALDVDTGSGVVMFSPTLSAESGFDTGVAPDQLMVASLIEVSANGHEYLTFDANDSYVGPLLTAVDDSSPSTDMSSQFGIGPAGNDANGLCGIDPESDTTVVATPVEAWMASTVSPQTPTPGGVADPTLIPATLPSLSALRTDAPRAGRLDGTLCDVYAEVAGWGGLAPQDVDVTLQYRLMQRGLGSSGPQVVLGWTSLPVRLRPVTHRKVGFIIEDVPSTEGYDGFAMGGLGYIELRATLTNGTDTVPTLLSRMTLFDEL